MFGFLGLGGFGFGVSEKTRKEQAERRDKEMEERMKAAVPWTPNMPWSPKMTLTAASWPEWSLFDVKPTKHGNINHEARPEDKFVLSPNGTFVYCAKTLPRQSGLRTLQGSRKGDVYFDGPVNFPALHEKQPDGQWREDPWMSITPMEVMTQRPGTKLARGHVVIAGLGLGWGLVEAFKKRTVTKVTLVERSQELVDWIMPALAPRLRGFGKDFDTIVGDARDVLVDYKADVALIDIFKGYGGNEFFVRGDRGVNIRPRNIPTVWCWGSAPIADEPRSWF
jgi:hypothetical protein